MAITTAAKSIPSARIAAGLLAGAGALALNLAAIEAASLAGVPTAHGGLLRLVAMVAGIPTPSGAAVQIGFHAVVGLGMAVAYALVLEPVWPGHPAVLGSIAGVAVWVLNASIVLPLTGDGFAGRSHLDLLGILWFAAAHMLFFLALAFGVDRFASSHRGLGGGPPAS